MKRVYFLFVRILQSILEYSADILDKFEGYHQQLQLLVHQWHLSHVR